MSAANIGGNAPGCAQSKREFAHSDGVSTMGFARLALECHGDFADGRSSKRSAVICQHRYPSPCRSALFQSRPTSLSGDRIVVKAASGLHVQNGLAIAATSVDSARAFETNKGRQQCLRLLRSSLWPQFSDWPAVWNPTSSARSQVQPRVRLQPTQQASIRQPARLPVGPLACCVTTPASAAPHATDHTARHGRTTHLNRRRGRPSAAFSRLKD